jgi:superfamily II DNA or RNA helicase
MRRRNFNSNEREILYRAAGGKCQQCGRELYGVFHADHIKPFALGGITDVINGQVLCEECNLMKSDKYDGLPDWTMELRDWQRHAWQAYQAAAKQDFLAVATPGAGKTLWCLRIAHFLLTHGIVEQIAIVAPSDGLRDQWREEAKRFGIELQKVYDAGVSIAPDQHGIVTTYQTVAARRDTSKSYRLYTSRRRTFVIFDEIHHAGDGLTWGNAIRQAFEFAVRRLAVTGTPFRSDNSEIPFVAYDLVNGQRVSRPDFIYGYGEALRDGVVRPVYFQTYDGDISWLSGDEIITASFSDELGEGRRKERLRAAISPQGNWLQEVLGDAHKNLKEIRARHPGAGGLVVAKDKSHAIYIAGLLEKISGSRVTVVTYDDDAATEMIKTFRDSTEEWIVAVKMVSEGVDIKRLRVCVYATNVMTELFFRQVVGRVVRMLAGIEDQDAWVYIPKEPTIVGYAEALKDERNHVIEDDQDTLLEEAYNELKEGNSTSDNPLFAVIRAAALKDNVIHGAASFSVEELARAAVLARDAGLPDMNPVAIAMILRQLELMGMSMPSAPATETDARSEKPKSREERKQELRRKKGPIATATVRLIEAANGRITYNFIAGALNDAQEVETVNQCTLEQLVQRIEILEAWRKAFIDGNAWREFTPKRYVREHSSRSLERGIQYR